MSEINVVVHGALGRMGKVTVDAVYNAEDMQLLGAIDFQATQAMLDLTPKVSVPLSNDAERLLDHCHPNVIVDFSLAGAVMPLMRLAAARGINVVSGTTGLSVEEQSELKALAEKHDVCIVFASNFALGAVLLIHLAKVAGKYMDNAEIIELHHNQKADAPSGTAISTARAMTEARGKDFEAPLVAKNESQSRGQNVGNIPIHSVRLPGYMAHEEVLFGASGQTLSIRHDTINRECYMPGVLMAIREAVQRKGFINGLDSLLGL